MSIRTKPDLLDHEGQIYISVASIAGALDEAATMIENQFPETVSKEDVAEGFRAFSLDIQDMHTRVTPKTTERYDV